MVPVIADDEIVRVLGEVLPDMRALLLFGSCVNGIGAPGSDLDLAVLLPNRADPVGLWLAGEAVAARLGIDVDLIDLRGASTVMQFQIITAGRILYAADGEIQYYAAFILSEMTALNEARAPLLADINREGRIYG